MVTLSNELVEFAFYRPDAQEVQLAGDFNDWQPSQLPMVRSEDGYWTARVPLPAGEFKFRYWADGQWFTDFAAFGVEPGSFGLDSVVRVPHPPLKVAQPGPQGGQRHETLRALACQVHPGPRAALGRRLRVAVADRPQHLGHFANRLLRHGEITPVSRGGSSASFSH